MRDIETLQKRVKELEASTGAAGAAAGRMIPQQAFTNLARWGSQIQWAGRQLMFNFTLPIISAGVAITKWVLDQESAMTRLKKVYGDTASGAEDFARDVDGLSKAFRLLSEHYAVQQSQVTEIAADWAAAGATGGALARGVETTLKAMILGEMEAVEATKAVIAIQAQYGASSEGLMRIIEKLNMVENETATTFNDLVVAMSRSAGAARSAGVDVDHLAAMIAALVPASGGAEQAGNSLRTMMSRIMSPTSGASDIMELMGINVSGMAWQSMNAAQRIEHLAVKFHELEGASDAMTSSLAGVVSAELASRWNINRFDVLMRSVYAHMDGNAETTSYYSKALEVLSEDAAVSATAMNELNAVLTSNPMVVKRAGIVIQNELMEVVTMIMPQIMWFIELLKQMIQWFTNLDPAIQKTVIGVLAFLAVLGPPIIMIGALSVAIGQLGNMFIALGGLLRGLGPILARVFTPLLGLVRGAFTGIAGVIRGAGSLILGLITRIFTGIPNIIRSALTAAGGLIARFFPGLARVVAAIAPRLLATIVPALAGPIGIAISLAIQLIWIFRDEIGEAFQAVGRFLADGLASVGRGIQTWLNDVGKFFGDAINNIARAFAELPRIVADAFRAVLNTISSIGRAIYEGLQWLNPFARHSPSLVENVQAGMALVAAYYGAAATRVVQVSARAGRALSSFGAATRGFMDRYEKMQRAENASLLRDHAGSGAASAYLALEDSLVPLRAEYNQLGLAVAAQEAKTKSMKRSVDSLSAALDEQRSILDALSETLRAVEAELNAAESKMQEYASAPLVGMREMSDAMFDNEMAQKRLQLAMMDWEDVHGSIDDVQSGLASLQGEIEALRGEANDLQAAGAGSDILGPIRDQIREMEDAYREMGTAVDSTPIEEMQTELDRLKREGERLDLENAIQFDPLTREIGQLVEEYEELEFDEITAGIKRQQESIKTLQSQYNSASRAVEDQERAVARAQSASDAARKAYDAERKILEDLSTAYSAVGDQIQAIESAMSSAIDAAQGLARALEEVEKAGKTPALSAAQQRWADASGGAYPDAGDGYIIGQEDYSIDQWIDDFLAESGSMFQDIDIGASLREWWDGIITGLKAWWDELPGKIRGWWDDLVAKIKTWWDEFVAGLKSWWDQVPERLGAWWSGLIESIKTWWNDLISKFKTWWDDFVSKLGTWWDNLKKRVETWFENTFVKPVQNGLQNVRDNFEKAKNWISEKWDELGKKLKEAGDWIDRNVFTPIKNGVGTVGDKFDEARKWIGEKWDQIKETLDKGAQWIDDNVFTPFKDAIDAVGEAFETTKRIIDIAWSQIGRIAAVPVNFVIETVYMDGIRKVWNSIADAVGLNLKLPKVDAIRFADGSEDHRAQIARGGAWRVWAEPETGGEAYIPLAQSKRRRSTEILQTVANRFGYHLHSFADGGILDGAGRFFGGIWKGISGVAKWVVDGVINVASFFSDPIGAITDLIKLPVDQLLKNIGGGELGRLLVELPGKAIKALGEKVKSMIGSMFSGGEYEGALGGWRRPSYGPITSRYGPRNLLGGTFHNGIDIAGGGRTFAANYGTVRRVGWNVGYGNTGIGILLSHGNGLESYYGHNPVGGVQVRPGQMVNAGQHIGYQGATGKVTGVHLHYSIFRNGRHIKPDAYGIYDDGGYLQRGTSIVRNATNSVEPVLTAGQWGNITRMVNALDVLLSRSERSQSVTENNTYNFYGDLSFPNVKDGDDADDFVRNLKDLAGGH